MLIFGRWRLNITDFSTLPSLAFGIYRAHYLKDFKIPLISGKTLEDIRQGYYGGHTDVYIPYGKNIYCYDVNSLFPKQMYDMPMPTGNIQFFEGNILADDCKIKDPFGFFLVEITAPKDLKHPILMTRVNNNNQTATIAPLGTWTDVIFSEEMFNAIKYGYTFKVLRGYLFEREYIFKDYVNDLYSIKSSVSKSDPMYTISKLLLNSLYGRFGMSSETYLTKTKIVNSDELCKLSLTSIIDDTIDLGFDQHLVTYINESDMDSDNIMLKSTVKSNINISIGISAAITSYARIYMSQFKNNPDYNLYYTDTDSIYIDKPLDSQFVSENELGQLKLEQIFDGAVFIAPTFILIFYRLKLYNI